MATLAPQVPLRVYIKDSNSGLVLQYSPQGTGPYEVTIENPQTGNFAQHWFLLDTGVPGYIYIQNTTDPARVLAAGDEAGQPLRVSMLPSTLAPSHSWILREPDNGPNPNFVIMSVSTGMVIDVAGASKDPGTRVQINPRSNGEGQQFSFSYVYAQ